MVVRILAVLLLFSGIAWAVEKPYYQYPDTGTLPDDARILIYDGSSSKNITGAKLRAAFKNRTTSWAFITGKPAAIHGGRF